MSKDPANLERALAKKARKAERKAQEKARKTRIETFHTGEVNISQASNWKLDKCWINEDWQDHKSLNQLIITRRSGAGYIAAALFLIDLGCLGIKNADTRGFADEFQFRNELLEHVEETQDLQLCSVDFAAKMVYNAMAYARGLGFEPHKDARKAIRFLHDAQPENCADVIPLGGEDGKPFYVNGPFDDETKILRTLDRTVGEGNYDFVMMADDLDDLDDLEIPDDLRVLLEQALEENGFGIDGFEDDKLEDDKIIDVKAHTDSQ